MKSILLASFNCIRFVSHIMLGDKAQTIQYTHHGVLVTACLAYGFSVVFNYFLDLSNHYNILFQCFLSITLGFIWYRSRWKNQFSQMAIFFMFAMPILAIPTNWLANGGSSGPTYLICITTLAYISVAFHHFGLYKIAAQLMTVLMIPPLVYIEQYYPQWIYTHPTKDLLVIDLFVTYCVVSLVLILLMKSNSDHFKLEQAKSDSLSEQLRILSEHDSLTGLFNRRILEQDFEFWQKEQQPFCLALLDIDHFKSVNDQWGHAYGDKVLTLFADLLKVHASKTHSLPIRLGGEEFVLLIPMDSIMAEQNLKALARQLASIRFEHENITFSAGITQVTNNSTQIDALKQADILMYQAKNSGRNCIVSDHNHTSLSV